MPLLRALNALFAQAFDDPEAYLAMPPSENYVAKALANEHVIALVAMHHERAVGGLVAYRFDKLEQARSEIYIYDLAVAAERRRQGIATALIVRVREIAAGCGAWAVYVQADLVEAPAIALYTKLGVREDVLHFDFMPLPPG